MCVCVCVCIYIYIYIYIYQKEAKLDQQGTSKSPRGEPSFRSPGVPGAVRNQRVQASPWNTAAFMKRMLSPSYPQEDTLLRSGGCSSGLEFLSGHRSLLLTYAGHRGRPQKPSLYSNFWNQQLLFGLPIHFCDRPGSRPTEI